MSCNSSLMQMTNLVLRRFVFAACCLQTAAFLHAAELEPGFKSLFNGKDLTGWDGNPKLWSVKDGTITGITGSDADTKINHNTFLVWKGGDVADFELRLSYRIEKGNSGIQYRSKVTETGKFGPIVGGYQADFEAGKTYSGILYEERGRGILAQRGQKTVIKEVEETKDGKTQKKTKVEVTGSVGDTKEIQAKIKDEDWNDYVVIAKGNHLQHFINDQQTVDVIDEQPAKAAKAGALALQIHTGPPMVVQFKNIRLKKLSGDSARNDLEQLQGKWLPVEIVANGKPVGEEVLKSITVTIAKNSYKTELPDGGDAGTFKINDSASPKQMDLSSASGKEIPAIYEVSGDTLKACYTLDGGDRPSEFKSAEDSKNIFVTYKRKTD
jgi:uncharacterized protein (TIGR03067 family)